MPLIGGHLHVEAVKIVPLPMLQPGNVLGVLAHGDLGSIKDRWFVHIVPCECVQRRSLVLVE